MTQRGGAVLYLTCGKIRIDILTILWFFYLTLMCTHYNIPKIPMLFVLAIFGFSLLSVFVGGERTIRLRDYGPFLFMAGFVSYMLLSNIWAKYTGETMLYITEQMFNEQLRLVMLAFSICVYCSNWERFKRMLYMLLITTTYFAVVYMVTSPFSTWGTTNMMGITDIWRNGAAMLGIFSGVIGVYLIGQTKQIFAKVIVTACMVICFVLAIATGSRAGFLMLLLFAVLYFFFQRKLSRKLLFLVVVAIGVIVFLQALAKYEFLQSAYIDRLRGIFDSRYDDGSVEVRSYLIEVGLELFRDNMFFGVGPEGVRTYLTYIGYAHPKYAHSNYVEMLADFGLVGTLFFYGFFTKHLYSAFRYRKRFPYLFYALVLLIMFFAMGFTNMIFNARYIMVPYLILVQGVTLTLRAKDTEALVPAEA